MRSSKKHTYSGNITLRYLGVLIVSLGIILLTYEYYFIARSVVATGKVIHLDSRTNYSNKKLRISSYMVISFTTLDKKQYTFTTNNLFFAKRGNLLTVYYDPKNPSNALTSNKIFYFILTSFGVILFILSRLKLKGN